MSFRENDKQVDEVLKNHVVKEIEFTKDQKTLVYKRYTDLLKKKKGNERWVLFSDLYEEVHNVIPSKEVLQAILANLEENGKLAMENGKIFPS